MTTKMIANTPFKYDGKQLEIGDEFIPVGGKWDHILTDPEKKYIRIEEVEEPKPKKKKLVKKKPAAKKKAKKKTKYTCDYCERVVDSPQGKAAHTRFCKQKE